MKKRLITFASALILTIAFNSSSVLASTTDFQYSFNNTSAGTLLYTIARPKDDRSSVFTRVDATPTTYTYTTVQAQSVSGTWYDKNINGGYVSLKKGINYSIKNWVWEHGYRTARLKLQTSVAGKVSGWWSADSSKQHTVCN